MKEIYYAVINKNDNEIIHDGFGAKIFTNLKDAELGHLPSENVKIVPCQIFLEID